MAERYEKPLWDEVEGNLEKVLTVNYKELDYKGEFKIVSEEYLTWDEIGTYTAFYSDVSHDSLELLIPTTNIIKITFTRYQQQARGEIS